MSGANTLVWMQPPQLSSTNLWLGTSFYTDAVFRDIDDIQGAETSNVRHSTRRLADVIPVLQCQCTMELL